MSAWTDKSTEKFIATVTKKYGSYEKFQEAMGKAALQASRPGTGGFADKKIGKDGLTGKQRASKVAQGRHKNDPEIKNL